MADSVPKGVGGLLVMGHVELDICRLPIVRLKPKLEGPWRWCLLHDLHDTGWWVQLVAGNMALALYLDNEGFSISLPRMFRG